jgi:hypothetical protein
MKQIQIAYPIPKCHIIFNNKTYLNCTENLKAFKFSSNYAANFIKVSQMKQIQTLDEVEFSIFSSNYTNIKHFSTVEYIQTAQSSKYSNSAQIFDNSIQVSHIKQIQNSRHSSNFPYTALITEISYGSYKREYIKLYPYSA